MSWIIALFVWLSAFATYLINNLSPAVLTRILIKFANFRYAVEVFGYRWSQKVKFDAADRAKFYFFLFSLF